MSYSREAYGIERRNLAHIIIITRIGRRQVYWFIYVTWGYFSLFSEQN